MWDSRFPPTHQGILYQHSLTYLSFVFIKNKQNWRVFTPKVLHFHISMKRVYSIYLHLYTVIWQRVFRFSTSVHRLLTVIFQMTDFQSGLSDYLSIPTVFVRGVNCLTFYLTTYHVSTTL